MLTYQVKITVEPAIETEWLHWMKTTHVPDVIATGLLKSYQILKAEEPAHTYYFHYHFEGDPDYQQYQEQHAPGLKEHVLQKFPNQFKAERMLFRWV